MPDALNLWLVIILVGCGYFLGAIPFGLLIGRAKGVDVRKAGSGNIGSTNVSRLLGKKWGYFCFLLDVAKGFVPVLIAGAILKSQMELTTDGILPRSAQIVWVLVATACILGHVFSIYLGFKGGKGVATSLGVLLGIYPYFTLPAVFTFLIWAAVWGLSRYVSLASLVAAVAFPTGFALIVPRISKWSLDDLLPLFVFSCVMAVLVIVRHRSNIVRLLNGTENRGSTRQAPTEQPAVQGDTEEANP